VPALSFASKTALYSVGAVGEKTTSISGCFFNKGGQDGNPPDLQVIIAPAFKRELGLSLCPKAPYAGQSDQPEQNVTNLFNMGPSILGSDPAQNFGLPQTPAPSYER
jgi:hypothetical protein